MNPIYGQNATGYYCIASNNEGIAVSSTSTLTGNKCCATVTKMLSVVECCYLCCVCGLVTMCEMLLLSQPMHVVNNGYVSLCAKAMVLVLCKTIVAPTYLTHTHTHTLSRYTQQHTHQISSCNAPACWLCQCKCELCRMSSVVRLLAAKGILYTRKSFSIHSFTSDVLSIVS